MPDQQSNTLRLGIILALFCMTLVPITASADELIMRDGSRLLGEVVKRTDQGVLHFKTSYAGEIKVKWDQVAELKSDKPMEFLLEDDSTV